MNETVDPSSVREARKADPPPVIVPVNVPVRRRPVLKIIAVLVLAVGIVLLWQRYENIAPATVEAQRSGAPASNGPPPQTIRAAEAAKGDMPITIDALGVVTPLAMVTVRTQISGKLMEVGFTEGQHVKRGDFLAQVDPRPFEATLAQAQGQLAKDTSLWQQAQADLARYVTLNKQDSIAHQQVDDQTFLVAQDKAAMASDQAQIDAAKLNIGYAHIVAPIEGRVGLRLIDAGNYVQPTDANGLVVITQLDPISVVFSTPEDNLPRITKRLDAGAKLAVTVYDRSNVKLLATGELTTFDNQIDTTTGTFKLRATFANPDNALFPNQFVNVRLLVDTLSGVVLAPNAAVQLGQSGSFVYLLNQDSTVSVRNITTGASNATQTVVESGLAAGDKVVTDGVDRLRDGAKVRFAGADSAGAGSNTSGPAGAASPGDPSSQHHKRHRGANGESSDPADGKTH